MRKCDICSTVIPFGTDRCPNCGYQYKPEIKISEFNRDKQKKEYMSQFKPHPSPLDELKKIDFSRQRVRNPRVLEITKLLLMAGMAIVWACVIISLAFNQLAPNGFEEYEEVYPVQEYIYDYETLSDEYPEIAPEVKPYYIYMDSLNDQFAPEGYVLSEIYEVWDDELDYADISATFLYNDIYVGVSLGKYESYAPWEIVYQISGSEISDDAIEAMAFFTGVDHDSMRTFVDMSFEGYYEYYVEDGIFVVDKYDDLVFISYTTEKLNN